MKQLEALLLDFDGTIVNNLPGMYSLYLRFLERFQIQGTEEEFQKINGPSLEEFIGVLKDKHALEDSLDELIHWYRLEIDKVILHPFEGVERFLLLARKEGVRLAIVTSSNQRRVVEFLKRNGWMDYFEVIIASEQFRNGKPHPEPYLNALNLLNVEAEACLAIEDSPNGRLSAEAAGLKTVLFTGDWSSVKKQIFHV